MLFECELCHHEETAFSVPKLPANDELCVYRFNFRCECGDGELSKFRSKHGELFIHSNDDDQLNTIESVSQKVRLHIHDSKQPDPAKKVGGLWHAGYKRLLDMTKWHCHVF